MSKKDTGNSSRGILGVGSVINTNHTGVTKRPTETRAGKRLDEITAEEIKKNREGQESPMNNPYFGRH